ncbi:MAG: inositol monophosphatase [Armatimonadota bacterium]|nr:inositol monophosphatase [Armatimonadota bacterium]
MSLLLCRDLSFYQNRLRQLHLRLRDHLYRFMRMQDPASLAQVSRDVGGDTQYAIDTHLETLLIDLCREWARESPLVLIAEGISEDGWYPLPEGIAIHEAEFLLLVDPIDGTRPLMYDKRSAWLLSAILPNFGRETTLEHVLIAMQTELPTTRQYLAYHVWAIRGQGAHAEIHNMLTGEIKPAVLTPSRAETLEHGFATFVKPFPEGKRVIAELEAEFWARTLGESINPLVFEDQYASTGGQLFELMSGRDRFVADVRPWAFARMGLTYTPLTCHPYDICTALIAQELGVQITDLHGEPLRTPIDIHAPVGWIGYANLALRRKYEPVLLKLMWG